MKSARTRARESLGWPAARSPDKSAGLNVNDLEQIWRMSHSFRMYVNDAGVSRVIDAEWADFSKRIMSEAARIHSRCVHREPS